MGFLKSFELSKVKDLEDLAFFYVELKNLFQYLFGSYQNFGNDIS